MARFGKLPAAPAKPDLDNINFHAQTTFVEQGYPAIRSPYQGTKELRGRWTRPRDRGCHAVCRRLWQGGPSSGGSRIDQGYGLANTHGVAGFPSAEGYKLGLDEPYARVQRAIFCPAGHSILAAQPKWWKPTRNVFAGSANGGPGCADAGQIWRCRHLRHQQIREQSKDRFPQLGKVFNGGTFDYAGDGWGFTYGGAAEWSQGRWTLRGGYSTCRQPLPAG